jgi:hypothetical protein
MAVTGACASSLLLTVSVSTGGASSNITRADALMTEPEADWLALRTV